MFIQKFLHYFFLAYEYISEKSKKQNEIFNIIFFKKRRKKSVVNPSSPENRFAIY